MPPKLAILKLFCIFALAGYACEARMSARLQPASPKEPTSLEQEKQDGSTSQTPTKPRTTRLKGVGGYKDASGKVRALSGCPHHHYAQDHHTQCIVQVHLKLHTPTNKEQEEKSPKPRPPKDGLPKSIRHYVPPSKAHWDPSMHKPSSTYLWREHGYMCPAEYSFFGPELEPAKLTCQLQHLAGNTSVWSGDASQIGADILTAIGGIMHSPHMDPLDNQLPKKSKAKSNKGVCACTTMLTKSPFMLKREGGKDEYSSLCMEYNARKVGMSKYFRVHPKGYLEMLVGYTRGAKGKLQQVYEKVHRVLLNLLDGLDSECNVVCHTCDNKRCLNPMHILWGTHAINRAARGASSTVAIYANLVLRRQMRWNARRARHQHARQLGGVCKRVAGPSKQRKGGK